MVAANIARADVTVDQASAVKVSQGVSQGVCRSGEAPEAILATAGGQMRQQMGPCQLVGYQKESASQWAFGDTSGVPNPDDATVVEFTETTELIKQAADGRCFQSSRKELHGTGCMVGQVVGGVDVATGSPPQPSS
jgi:hypothetical protein